MATTTYRVVAERDGHVWLVTVPAVRRVTQARTVGEIETMARDLIALMLDVSPASFELSVELRLPQSVSRHLSEATRVRDLAAAAKAEAAEEWRAAARELPESGLSMRDVGQVLGVSQHRVHQLVSG